MKHWFITSMVILILSSCSPQIQVHSDIDPDYDLWTYATFDWGQKVDIEQGRNPLHYNELNDKRIKLAVQEQMGAHGFRLTCDNPDLLLHYHIIVDDRSVVLTEPYGYQYGSYWNRMNTSIYSYREGTLILDLMETKTNHLVWRGWVVTAIDDIKPDKVEPLIKKVVQKIFKKFPYQGKKTDTTEAFK